MFSYFEPNFLEKFLWERGFSNFGQNRNDAKQKSVIWPPFWNGTTFLNFFPGLWFFIVRTHMVQISLQHSGGKVVFYAWVPIGTPPWAPTGVKVPWSLLTLKSVKSKYILKHYKAFIIYLFIYVLAFEDNCFCFQVTAFYQKSLFKMFIKSALYLTKSHNWKTKAIVLKS